MQILSLTSMYNKVYKMGCFEITNSMEIEYLIGDLTALFACVFVCFCIHVYIDIFLCFVGYLIHISLSGLANWFSAAIVYIRIVQQDFT